MPHMILKEDRLDAWFDGSSVCVIAISAQNEPLDLSADEVAALIAKLQGCLEEIRAKPLDNSLDFNGLDFSK